MFFVWSLEPYRQEQGKEARKRHEIYDQQSPSALIVVLWIPGIKLPSGFDKPLIKLSRGAMSILCFRIFIKMTIEANARIAQSATRAIIAYSIQYPEMDRKNAAASSFTFTH